MFLSIIPLNSVIFFGKRKNIRNIIRTYHEDLSFQLIECILMNRFTSIAILRNINRNRRTDEKITITGGSEEIYCTRESKKGKSILLLIFCNRKKHRSWYSARDRSYHIDHDMSHFVMTEELEKFFFSGKKKKCLYQRLQDSSMISIFFTKLKRTKEISSRSSLRSVVNSSTHVLNNFTKRKKFSIFSFGIDMTSRVDLRFIPRNTTDRIFS